MYYVLKIGEYAFVDFFDSKELATLYIKTKKIEDEHFGEHNEYIFSEVGKPNTTKCDVLEYFQDYEPDEDGKYGNPHDDEDETELYNKIKAVLINE
jgi:hypothetical protein